MLSTFSSIFFIWCTILFILVTSAPIEERKPNALEYLRNLKVKKLIVDVDAGSDDGFALLLALAKPRANFPKIIAITCTHGNTALKNVAINVLKTLRLVGLEKTLPVYMGANNSLLITPHSDNFYGEDGFGDVPYPNPPDIDEVQKEFAANALVRLVNEDPGNVAVIATGPLSNIAMATRLDSKFRSNLKALYWMGGSVQGQGNIKPGIEFNAYMDPEANFIVFNSTGCPVIVFPWESCTKNGYTSTKWRTNMLGKIKSPTIEFLNAIEGISLNKSTTWAMCDGKTMATLINPDVVKKASAHNVIAVFGGMHVRGALMVDYNDDGIGANAVIIEEIHVTKFKNTCIENLS